MVRQAGRDCWVLDGPAFWVAFKRNGCRERGPVPFSHQQSDCVARAGVPANTLPERLPRERQLVYREHGIAVVDSGLGGGRRGTLD